MVQEEEKEIIEIKCPYCPYKSKGYTDKEVNSHLIIHKIHAHPDKVKIVEKIKSG